MQDRCCRPCKPQLNSAAFSCIPPLQEKNKIKEEKEAAEAKYKVAYVDGRPEPVRLIRECRCSRNQSNSQALMQTSQQDI
jgi:hypothetical protein